MGEFLYEALGDPNFYVGALAVIVPVFVALVSRRRNKLFFDVVCEAMLIELKDGDGKEKQAAKKTERSRNGIGRVLFIIDLRNPSWGVLGQLGGVDIPSSSYEREISFGFGEGARVLEAGVVEEHPEGIGAEAYRPLPKVDRLALRPVLLNQGDSICLRAVVENPRVAPPRTPWPKLSALFEGSSFFTVRIDGRVLGIRSLQQERGAQDLRTYALWAGSLAVLPSVTLALLGWLLTGDYTWLLLLPTPFPETLTIVSGAQAALLFVSQGLLLLYGGRILRARKIADKYGPPSTRPMPML